MRYIRVLQSQRRGPPSEDPCVCPTKRHWPLPHPPDMNATSPMKLLSQSALGLVVGALLLGSNASAQAGNIPPGSTVNSAFLTVFVNFASGNTINVHRVTAPWTEATVTWNS